MRSVRLRATFQNVSNDILQTDRQTYMQASWSSFWYIWFRGTVVERRSVTGELSLSCARPVADGWPLMWVNHLLQGQPTRPTQPFILVHNIRGLPIFSCGLSTCTFLAPVLAWSHFVFIYYLLLKKRALIPVYTLAL